MLFVNSSLRGEARTETKAQKAWKYLMKYGDGKTVVTQEIVALAISIRPE